MLDKTDRGELDVLIRGILAKQGVTDEAEIQVIVELAELEMEQRIKIEDTRKEVRRLMEFRKRGLPLMQVGYRKWKPAWYFTVLKSSHQR